jgi:hypothetical protein
MLALRAVLMGFGGLGFLFLVLAVLILRHWLPAAAAQGLLYVAVLASTAVLSIVLEEYLHAIAVVQAGGTSALLGMQTRCRRLTGLPLLPGAVHVLYAPSLDPASRARVAAAGAFGAALILTPPALIAALWLGSAWVLALLLVPLINLAPLHRMGAGPERSDGDALLYARERLGISRRRLAATAWGAAWSAFVLPLPGDEPGVGAVPERKSKAGGQHA